MQSYQDKSRFHVFVFFPSLQLLQELLECSSSVCSSASASCILPVCWIFRDLFGSDAHCPLRTHCSSGSLLLCLTCYALWWAPLSAVTFKPKLRTLSFFLSKLLLLHGQSYRTSWLCTKSGEKKICSHSVIQHDKMPHSTAASVCCAAAWSY